MKTHKYYRNIVYKIIGAAMEVHRELHWGLLEPIYNEALCYELRSAGLDCESEQEIKCYYKNHLLQKTYRMDIVVGDICVELKSVSELTPDHRCQLMNYLRLTKKPLGILINFGARRLQGERYAYDENTNECYIIDKNMNRLIECEDDE